MYKLHPNSQSFWPQSTHKSLSLRNRFVHCQLFWQTDGHAPNVHRHASHLRSCHKKVKSCRSSTDLCKVSIGLDVQKHQSPLSNQKISSANPRRAVPTICPRACPTKPSSCAPQPATPTRHSTQPGEMTIVTVTVISYDSYDYQAILTSPPSQNNAEFGVAEPSQRFHTSPSQ